MTWIGFLIVAPVFAASVVAMGIGAVQTFEGNYMETLCRMESVRVNALQQIEDDEPLTADFGGEECDAPEIPTVDVTIIIETPTATPTAEPTPSGG